jgi:hypothetical protein
VLVDGVNGPRPVLEAYVFAGVEPPSEKPHHPAPGEEAGGEGDGANALTRMMMLARRSESLPGLIRDTALAGRGKRRPRGQRRARAPRAMELAVPPRQPLAPALRSRGGGGYRGRRWQRVGDGAIRDVAAGTSPAASLIAAGGSGGRHSMWNSTRRFFWRPPSVSLGARGRDGP